MKEENKKSISEKEIETKMKSIWEKEIETFKKYAHQQVRCMNILMSEMGFGKEEALEFLKVFTLRDIEGDLNLCMELLLRLNLEKKDRP